MRRAAAAAIAVGLVGIAALVTWTTPDDEASTAPYVVHAEPGEVVAGRDIQAQLGDPRLVDALQIDDWAGSTEGVWLVVDAKVSPVLTGKNISAELRVGPYLFDASRRPSTRIVSGLAGEPGLPYEGVIVFELPPEVAELPGADRATLAVASSGDPRLDSVIETVFDLTELDVRPLLRLPQAERTVW